MRDIWSLSEYRTDKYSQRNEWPIWENGWVFVYELSDCSLEYRCCHIWCLNAFAKLQNARGASPQPLLMENYPLIYMCWLYQSTEWFVISLFQVVCQAWNSVVTREVPLEKKVDTKYMQVNVIRNIASMTKRGDDIPTH